MVLRPNALKSSHFSHSKCYIKPHLWRESLETWYIHSLESLLVHIFRFSENFEIWGDFLKNNKKSQNFQNFQNFKNPRWQFCSWFFSASTGIFRLSSSLKLSVWQRFPQTLIFDLKWQNMTTLWRHSRPTYHRCEIFLWSTCVELMWEGVPESFVALLLSVFELC